MKAFLCWLLLSCDLTQRDLTQQIAEQLDELKKAKEQCFAYGITEWLDGVGTSLSDYPATVRRAKAPLVRDQEEATKEMIRRADALRRAINGEDK